MYTWGFGQYGQLGLQTVADFVGNNAAVSVAVHQPQRVSYLEPSILEPCDRSETRHLATCWLDGNQLSLITAATVSVMVINLRAGSPQLHRAIITQWH
jgi:hypothetical protein